ncbi:MAG TPA: hypothetical protein VL749_06875 [Patescibacteria group bacterium]|nr:hypothetical protein [Patescibacteria group bacterium]
MGPRHRRILLAGAVAGTLLQSLTPIAAAHGHAEAGGFHVVIGWSAEPALVGQPNGIQLFVYDANEKPITDIPADAIGVVVSTGGQDSSSLGLSPAFDVEEGFGTPGEYSTEIIPTAPGDYTFHFTGTIHGTAIDVSMASGDETFDGVVAPADLEFPVKQPTLTEVGTRLDRIDGRIDALQSGAPAQGAIADAQATASAAQNAANQALLVGALLGGAGLVVAVIALWLVLRARRQVA